MHFNHCFLLLLWKTIHIIFYPDFPRKPGSRTCPAEACMSVPWVTVKPCSWDGPGQERTEVSVTDSSEFWEKMCQKRHTKPQPVLLERKALNVSLTLFSFIQEKDATEASVAEKLELAFVSVNPTWRHKGTRKPSFVSSAPQQDLCSPFEKKKKSTVRALCSSCPAEVNWTLSDIFKFNICLCKPKNDAR